MAVGYRAISWNRQKRRYDFWLALVVVGYLALFLGLGALLHPLATVETLLLRALATAAFLLLSVILSIGPLARLDARFLPLLYNRRHLGVTMFLLAALHAALATLQFHGFGVLDPLTSLLASNPRSDSFVQFPFEWLGLAALGILFLMAASSHDFWLVQFSAPTWKRLHLLVHGAYWLIVAHVALGSLSSDPEPLRWLALAAIAMPVLVLQVVAGFGERRQDQEQAREGVDWVPVGQATSIPDGRARIVTVAGERVAVFRDGARFFALSNVCQHQNGPLGEGRVRKGCAVCPWHGYEYELSSGRSPAPFTESVPQFRLRLVSGELELDPRPVPAGEKLQAPVLVLPVLTPVHPHTPPVIHAPAAPFYVGYEPQMPAALAAPVRRRVALLAGLCLALGALAAAFQPPFARANFDFGAPVELEGWIALAPVPHLEVPRPGSDSRSRYLLVLPGKHGVGRELDAFDGRFVALQGSLVYRDGSTLVELVPGSLVPASAPREASAQDQPPAAGASAASRSLGPQTLRGEIVDSKCFLGVMKPGELKSHRACASLCIRGGIPPVLLVRRADGTADYWVLVGPDGEPVNSAVLPYVAEPVELAGQGEAWGDLQVLRFDPQGIRRL